MEETKLHVIEQDGKFGYADENGNVVIPCVWDAAHEFSEGRAAVLKKGTGWGYIDMQDELVIPCVFVSPCDFKDGIACVNWDYDTDSDFYIDKNGTFIEFVFWDQEGTKSKVMAQARMLSEQGKYDEATECIKPEAEHEEVTTTARKDLMQYLYEAKRYEETIQLCKATFEEWVNTPNRIDPESNPFSDYEWAAWKLAKMYEEGVGVKQDMLEAVIYYDIIVWETGDDAATEKVKEILKKYPQLREELEEHRSDLRIPGQYMFKIILYLTYETEEIIKSLELSEDEVTTIKRLVKEYDGDLDDGLMPILKKHSKKLYKKFHDAIFPTVYLEFFVEGKDDIEEFLECDKDRMWSEDDIDYILEKYGDCVNVDAVEDAYVCCIPEEFKQ